MKKTQAALIVVISLMLVFFGASHAQDHGNDEAFLDLLDYDRAGIQAPNITFLNGDSESVSLQDFAGAALVVNFWATWCAPCIAEMPALDRLNQDLSVAGGQVIAISTDFDSFAAREWLVDNHIESLEAFFDETGNAFFDAGGRGLPHSIIIDPSGKIAAEVFGDAPWDAMAAFDFVSSLGFTDIQG